MKTDNRIDMFLGPSATFAGYVFLITGAVCSFENPAGFILVIAGLFMGFSYNGTIIDFNESRIKPYTALFGLIKLGKWYPVDCFDKFRIYRSSRSHTTYSRGNIPLTIKKTDIRLDFVNKSGSLKVTIDRFDSFESARDEASELIKNLHITSMEEWTRQ
ncbi:MAG TPA: hypothetical protein PLX08_04425 [Bacteroidales bacterium]|jgi:hypothetical protein|nr:hypothetical protein [Bacteroidales bacterium]